MTGLAHESATCSGVTGFPPPVDGEDFVERVFVLERELQVTSGKSV